MSQLKNEKEKFLDDYVVVVEDDGTDSYHKYGCSQLPLSSFWTYNIEGAKGKDYRPSLLCNSEEN